MSTTFSVAQTAISAGYCDTKRMSFSMPAICKFAAASACATTLIKTDVSASVSLFAVVLLVCLLLLVLISLLITGLTGLTKLESLVGLTRRAVIPSVQGD